MQHCFNLETNENSIPISVVIDKQFPTWLETAPNEIKVWLSSTQFRAEPGRFSLVPDSNGKVKQVISIVSEHNQFWCIGGLPFSLPEGFYEFAHPNSDHSIVWGLGAYQFSRYKKPQRLPASLYLPPENANHVLNIIDSIYLVRNWINTPTDDMGPTQFANVIETLAQEYGASLNQIIGEDLLKQNYPSIYTVGRASDDAPRLLDMRWGNSSHPKVTLVGKGVCFDTGGLDIKPSAYMLLMKKDMAGGAHAFGLARMIMEAKLSINLRVLVPVVENVISGNAYRPGDIIKSRKGITIEIGNTDAEGRVILADALTEAVSERPDLLIDLTTLTGAARVALGTELPAVFSNNDDLVNEVIQHGEKTYDPMWRLPLFREYRDYLNSNIADINNNSSEPYGGAITAALFLKEFVPDDIPWLHFDMMAWNLRTKPGRIQGAEATVLRALFSYLTARFA